jgi:O-antigen ligase
MTMALLRSRLQSLLGPCWMVLIAVTAIGHVTGLRNALTLLVAIGTLLIVRRDWRALPCKRIVAALAAWAFLSLLWSPVPWITFGKLRTDLLMPLMAALAAFHFVRTARGWHWIVAGLVLGLLALALLSSFAYIPTAWVPGFIPVEQSGGIVRPLPHWYPGPGDASMFAIVSLAPLWMAWRAKADRPLVPLAGLLLAAFVLITTNNRNAALVAPLVIAFQWLLDRRIASRSNTVDESVSSSSSKTPRRVLVLAAVVCAIVAMAAVLEYGARERLIYLHKPMHGDSAAIELVENDTRPVIWRYYFARGLEHPWIGMGFGRTVPGIGWHTESDSRLAEIEPNAYIHAHNVLLNWWLQLGVVGLLLLIALIASLAVTARALDRAAGRSTRAQRLDHALLALLLATTARNLTDDFLVYGMATVFAILVAALLGELSRLAAETQSGDGPVDRSVDHEPVDAHLAP